MKTMYDFYGNEYQIITEVYYESETAYVGYQIGEDRKGFRVRDNELTLITRQLYDQPPLEKRHKEVERINKDIKRLNEQYKKLQEDIIEVEEKYKERLNIISKYKGLQRLEDFLEGRITHFVISDYGPPELLTFEQLMKSDEDGWGKRNKELKLLTLYGKTNGDLTWCLNRYYDGSGCETEVIPCTSYEQALEECRKIFDKYIEEVMSGKRMVSRSWFQAAHSLGLTLPQKYEQILIEKENEKRETEIKKLQDRLNELMLSRPRSRDIKMKVFQDRTGAWHADPVGLSGTPPNGVGTTIDEAKEDLYQKLGEYLGDGTSNAH